MDNVDIKDAAMGNAYMESIENASLHVTDKESAQGFEWNDIADNGLATAALLLFLIALISQWGFGFYAADYYDSSAIQHSMNGSHKGFKNIDFSCDQNVADSHIKK